jgi:hypothetical protein
MRVVTLPHTFVVDYTGTNDSLPDVSVKESNSFKTESLNMLEKIDVIELLNFN